jgi:hypothetical protein
MYSAHGYGFMHTILRIFVIVPFFWLSSLAAPRVTLESDRLVFNDSVNISVHAYDIRNAGAISLKILYDGERIQPGRILKVNQKIDDALIVWDANSISVAWERIEGVALNDDVLIEFRFRYTGQNTQLAFDTLRCEIADSSAGIIAVKFENLILPALHVGELPQGAGWFSLAQNYPNPFNSECIIHFTVSKTATIIFEITSTEGVRAARLFNRAFTPGEYTVRVNAANLGLSSGIYLYTLRTARQSITKKLMYLK